MSDAIFTRKKHYLMEDLVEIIRLLRSPEGCPWDKVQTHSSIRSCMVEEAYEVVDAIDRQDAAMLQEELGDVLMQVVFHAGIAQDAGQFDLDAVCDGICRKMIFRHPHIFAQEGGIASPEQVLEQWENLKEQEKALHTAQQDLLAIPRGLPALIRAQKQHKRAARHGFGFDRSAPVQQQLAEELQALLQSAQDSAESRQACMGALLHGLCGLANAWGIDAERALAEETDRFAQRVAQEETRT